MKRGDLKKYLETSKMIEERAIKIIDHLHQRDTYRGTKYESYEVKDDKVLITWKDYAGCGTYDYYTESIDFKTFSNNNWLNLIQLKNK